MMRNQKATIVALAIVACAWSAWTAAAAEENREADHEALRALRDKVSTAIDKQDMKSLAACFAKQFAFTAVDQTVLTNEAQVQEFFDRMFRSSDAPIASLKTDVKADILTRFIGPNTGICYGSSKDTYTLKSGKVVEMNVRWSATVVKEGGEWKVALAHVGTDFLNNPILDGVKGLARNLGIGAGIGGLVVGLVIGGLIGRNRRGGSASQPGT